MVRRTYLWSMSSSSPLLQFMLQNYKFLAIKHFFSDPFKPQSPSSFPLITSSYPSHEVIIYSFSSIQMATSSTATNITNGSTYGSSKTPIIFTIVMGWRSYKEENRSIGLNPLYIVFVLGLGCLLIAAIWRLVIVLRGWGNWFICSDVS